MKNIEIFQSREFGSVRTLTIDGDVWFVGKDVAEALGYERGTKSVVDHVDADDRRMIDGKTQSCFGIELGQRGGWIINESGLYSLVLSSKLPSAKEFKHWSTSEVLPAIRQHGAYMTPEVIQNPDFVIQNLQNMRQEQERNRALEADNQRMRPKEIFADAVSVSKDGILVGALAKLIHQNGVEIGQKRLFQWLRDHGYLMKSGADKNMPTQRARDMDLFKVKERTINNPDGSVRLTRTTLVTGKGQQYFVNKFLAGRETHD